MVASIEDMIIIHCLCLAVGLMIGLLLLFLIQILFRFCSAVVESCFLCSVSFGSSMNEPGHLVVKENSFFKKYDEETFIENCDYKKKTISSYFTVTKM